MADDHPPPYPTGKTVELDAPTLLCMDGEYPSFLQILGGSAAIPVFTCPVKLERAVLEFGIPFTDVKQIHDWEEFLASVPPRCEVIIDPWSTPEGKVRYYRATGYR